MLDAGTSRYVSSANLIITFLAWSGLKSEAVMANKEGPRAEPCITLAVMGRGVEVDPSKDVM